MFNDDDLRKLLEHFDRPWAGYRKVRKGVKKRIWRQMQSLACRDMEAYLELVARRPEVRERCSQCLLVTISRFFRDRRLWDRLQDHALPVLQKLYPQGVHAWSAGCAGGEEPYSLAMVWAEACDRARDPGQGLLRIKATDANPECLERARLGIYGSGSLKEVPDDLRQRYFTRLPRHRWAVASHLKNCVDWEKHNLINDPPPALSPLHIVLLRNNLLTYYRGDMLRVVLERIIGTMAPGGLLVVGSHERLPQISVPLLRDETCPWMYQVRVENS